MMRKIAMLATMFETADRMRGKILELVEMFQYCTSIELKGQNSEEYSLHFKREKKFCLQTA